MNLLRPTLVYDGDCGICRTWIDYWRLLTGDKIAYRPYQEAAGDFPLIPVANFKDAMQLIEPDGSVYSGAAATFRLLSYAPSRGAWWWLYRHVPGFAGLSEWAYSFLSRRRGLLAGATHLLWGRTLEPERYDLVSWLFLRGLGLIYVAAFVSLALQIRGLVGHDGILPLAEYLAAARDGWGPVAYWRLPTLFWLDASDTALIAGAIVGIALGVLVTVGIFERLSLAALFVLYLSYVYAGQLFMSFQWDLLLLEAGFLAIFLVGGSRIVIWLYRLLLFRFLFLAGLVKLASGDPTWRQLTALDYHFWTQPLPTPLAWYAAQLPHWLLAGGTAAALIIELVAVVLIFLPRRPRMFAAVLVLLFQLAILLTGNFNFFNLLTVLLCLFLFDDQGLRRLVPAGLAARIENRTPRPGPAATATAAIVALVTVPLGLNLIFTPLAGRNLPMVGPVAEALSPLLIVNPYGVFATTTTTRPQIVIEGSDDGQTWRAYVLPYAPGPVARAPTRNIPYQPRLDWQLWFAAYGSPGENRWIERLLQRLLEGSPPVLALVAENPFTAHPPKYVRALLYDYRFTDAQEGALSGDWWVRRLEGTYYPSTSLADFQRTSGSAAPSAKASPPAIALPTR